MKDVDNMTKEERNIYCKCLRARSRQGANLTEEEQHNLKICGNYNEEGHAQSPKDIYDTQGKRKVGD